MKPCIKITLTALLLMCSGIACQAQQAQPAQQPAPRRQAVPPAVPQSLTQEQQAALDKQDQDVAQVAAVIVRLIDQNKAGEVWDQASPIAQRIISRDDFLKKIAHDRSSLGTPGMRMPLGVKHYRYDGTGNMPAGAYMNILFDTQFSQASQSSREMVTFILDSDKVWRFVGYSVR